MNREMFQILYITNKVPPSQIPSFYDPSWKFSLGNNWRLCNPNRFSVVWSGREELCTLEVVLHRHPVLLVEVKSVAAKVRQKRPLVGRRIEENRHDIDSMVRGEKLQSLATHAGAILDLAGLVTRRLRDSLTHVPRLAPAASTASVRRPSRRLYGRACCLLAQGRTLENGLGSVDC